MPILSRLLGKRHDDRAAVRPLWQRVVAIAREPQWYAECGLADTVTGRFDAITLVLALVLGRMEQDEALTLPSVMLSELFVEDMEGQLRQSGIGDVVVGKHIGKMMGALGGRLGAIRQALPLGEAALAEVVSRNATMVEGGGEPATAAARLLALADGLRTIPAAALLAGAIPR